jgi:hypothetical protein
VGGEAFEGVLDVGRKMMKTRQERRIVDAVGIAEAVGTEVMVHTAA